MRKTVKLDEQAINTYWQGNSFNSYDFLGAHLHKQNKVDGVKFAVWVPDVKSVQVVGDFNDWNGENTYMNEIMPGIWELFIPEVKNLDTYKYLITTHNGEQLYKADPYAFYSEQRPKSASKVYSLDNYKWSDSTWFRKRRMTNHFKKPLNIYEVHLGSWKQHKEGGPELETPNDYFLSYNELTETLIPYVKEMGYTHVELMPIMEHPFDGSWGYQLTGYFALTSRYGTPEDFMRFVDTCHNEGIGVILDWVPGHFCPDAHGLSNFNGTMLYERSHHAEWGTYKFNFGRNEVRSFLFSSATFWLDKYHIDGIRIDGVTSMVYLNYGLTNPADFEYNHEGGDKDLHAISFLAQLNENLATMYPGTFSVAEESTALPLVTYPPNEGGLGFHYKWDMGWMNDTLEYMSFDFPFRPYHHNLLTFSTMYAYNENFVCALSHDEVVHGKKSLMGRMPGDYWRQFANMRLLHLYQMTHTGAKLTFMGNEIATYLEWRYYQGIEWFMLEHEKHKQYHESVKHLNNLYLELSALWTQNYSHEGFEWIEADNNHQGILIYKRQGEKPDDTLIVVLNFHPETYDNYRIGVPKNCKYTEVYNSDEEKFGGSGKLNTQPIIAQDIPMHGREYSINVTIPPLGGFILKPVKESARRKKTNS